MIDLHCHILPGVDDGAKTIEDSLDMARMAVDEGISHILATPHHMNRSWINNKQDVIELVEIVQQKINDENIPLTIFPGQEIRIYGEIINDIADDTILFADELNQYVLIEFPTSSVPSFTERLFYDLQSNGRTPIIVHPERNSVFQQDPNKLKPFIDHGALAQLTAASYSGGFGKKIQKLSRQMIESNLVHILASDAHNTHNRAFHLNEAYVQLQKEYGTEKEFAFKQTAKDILNGDPVITANALSVKETFFSKWFK